MIFNRAIHYGEIIVALGCAGIAFDHLTGGLLVLCIGAVITYKDQPKIVP